MNLEWFYCFLETSRQGSLSKAGEKLNITQPALSKQIRSLEGILGVELFKRSSLGVELTEEGALLQERIPSILSEIESLQKDLINLNKLITIRLGTLPSIATYYLPDKLVAMSQNGIRAELKVMSTTSEIIDLLKNGSIDACIVQHPAAVPASYWRAELFSEPYYAVVPRSHRLSQHQSVGLEALQDEPLVVYPNRCDVRQSIVEAYQTYGLEPNLILEVHFGESIPELVAAGAGITILPEMIALGVSHLPLQAVPIEGFPVTRTICLLCPKPSIGRKLSRYF